jgi:serine protease Do
MEPGLNDTVFQIRDRIIAMDGKEISTISDISTLVKSHNVGDTITFSVYRNGRLIEVTATCYEYTPNIQFEK